MQLGMPCIWQNRRPAEDIYSWISQLHGRCWLLPYRQIYEGQVICTENCGKLLLPHLTPEMVMDVSAMLVARMAFRVPGGAGSNTWWVRGWGGAAKLVCKYEASML